MINKIPNVTIIPSQIKLINYDGKEMQNRGKCTMSCKLPGKENVFLDFYIVDTSNVSPAVLGLDHCKN